MLRKLVEYLGASLLAGVVVMALLGALDPAIGGVVPVASAAAPSGQPTAAKADSIPEDPLARAKFPIAAVVAPEVVDALAFLNKAVNASISSLSDQEHYGVAELWVMYPKDGKGDCEDYALTKLGVLSQAGYPVVANAKVVGVGVKLGASEFGHAILAVRLPGGEVAYLDNRFDEPMTRAELVAGGYQFFDWRA